MLLWCEGISGWDTFGLVVIVDIVVVGGDSGSGSGSSGGGSSGVGSSGVGVG